MCPHLPCHFWDLSIPPRIGKKQWSNSPTKRSKSKIYS
nr:MAG TPA: hypothetical protein [Caudoviricetes sp.]